MITKYFLGFSLCGTMLEFTLLIRLKGSKPDGKHNRNRDSVFCFFLSFLLSFKTVPVYACVAPGSVSPACSQECLLVCFPHVPLYWIPHNPVDSAFHKTFLDHFCPPWLFLLWVSLPAPELFREGTVGWKDCRKGEVPSQRPLPGSGQRLFGTVPVKERLLCITCITLD